MNTNKLNQMFMVILALSMAGACNPQPQEIKARLSPLEKATIVESAEFIGSLESLCSPTLKPSIKGRVSKIFVKLGDRVAAKTPLVQLIPAQQTSSDPFFISSPCTGIISEILVNEEENVSPSTPLLTLVQTQPLDVNVNVPVDRVNQLKLGMPVELIDQTGQIVKSLKVTSISSRVMLNEQSVQVKARLDNVKGQYRPGQAIKARLIWDQRPGVLVPTSAVTRAGGQAFVFVAQLRGESQFVAQKRIVKLGNIHNSNYQVISGLQPGEKLITSNISKLFDGAVIMPEQ